MYIIYLFFIHSLNFYQTEKLCMSYITMKYMFIIIALKLFKTIIITIISNIKHLKYSSLRLWKKILELNVDESFIRFVNNKDLLAEFRKEHFIKSYLWNSFKSILRFNQSLKLICKSILFFNSSFNCMMNS